jgi:hypothetical protein
MGQILNMLLQAQKKFPVKEVVEPIKNKNVYHGKIS